MARRTAARTAAWIGAALAAIGALQAGGCFQASGLGDITFLEPDGGAGGGGTACVSAAQCDDQNPCTTDACGATGVCTHAPIADGPAPAADQTKGDCKQVVCKGGVETTVADATDVPKASDPCTTASCNGETPVMKSQPDGTPCTLPAGPPGQCSGGKCESNGCTSTADCTSMGPCQTVVCNGTTGMCDYTNVTDGTPTPGVTQTTGDCHTHICLQGQDTNAEDDSDVPTLPAGMAGCADAVCDKGTPSLPLHATDSQCSTWMGNQPGFCDATGACTQCTQDSECAGTGPTDDCQHPACTGGTCKQTFTAAGTATTTSPPQVPGDCQQIQCDGNGGTKAVADANDAPNDPTGCNPWTCNGATPVQTKAADGTACGSSGLSCKNGVCQGCTTDSQCQSGGKTNGKCVAPNCTCTPSTCASLGLTCGTGPDGCGGTVNCNDGAKDGKETAVDCGGSTASCATRCAQGQACTVTSDCQTGLTCADGVCCNSACNTACTACTAALKGQGADGVCGAVAAGKADPLGTCTATAQSTCGETGTCSGSGTCALWASGTSCVTASCAGDTLTKGATCNGTGTCNLPSPPTVSCAPYLCVTNACATSCNVDTDCTAGNYCNASHQCVPKQSNGSPCTAADQCTSGHCAPAAAGGVCCTSDCTAKCQACTNALTGGANGTCSNVKNGTTDPSGACTDQGAASCGTDGKCTGGACEDYPAGTTGCTGATTCTNATLLTYTQCNGSGACTQGPMMSACPNNLVCLNATACATSCADDTQCVTGYYCDAPTCVPQLPPGAPCMLNDQCQSGICRVTTMTCK